MAAKAAGDRTLPWRELCWVSFALRCALLLTLDNSEPRYTLEFFPLLIVWGSFLFSLSNDDELADNN